MIGIQLAMAELFLDAAFAITLAVKDDRHHSQALESLSSDDLEECVKFLPGGPGASPEGRPTARSRLGGLRRSLVSPC